MYWILDLVFVCILLLIVILAVRRGFIRSVYRFAALIAAVFVAATFSAPAAEWIEKSFLRSAVYQAADSVISPVAEKADAFSPQVWTEALPESFLEAAKLFGVDIDTAADAVSPADERLPVKEQMTGAIADPIAHSLSRALGYAAVFLVSYAVFLLLGLLLRGVFQLPILRGIDRGLGLLFGLCEGAAAGILLARLLVALFGAYALSHPDFPYAELAQNTSVIAFFAALLS